MMVSSEVQALTIIADQLNSGPGSHCKGGNSPGEGLRSILILEAEIIYQSATNKERL